MPALSHPAKKRIPEVSAVVLLILIGLATWQGFRFINENNWVQHTLEVQNKISQTRSLVQQSELAQSYFVLTGEDAFLAPYVNSGQRLPGEINALANLVADNPVERDAVTSIRSLLEQRMAAAEKAIALRRAGNFEEARNGVLQGDGLRITQAIGVIFDKMLDEERRLLGERTARAMTSQQTTVIALALGLLAVIGAFGTWIVSARRSAGVLAATNEMLRQTIAEREAAEKQVLHMQKMDAIGQLTGGIAHDFNNMLAIVISGITLAQRRIERGQQGANDMLEGALDGANRATRLISRLLAFARKQPLSPKPLDANKFVAGLSELIARTLGSSIRVETVLGGGLWLTNVDAAQLEASVLNLCVNARDAMPEGGRLTIETANCYLDDRYAALHPGVPAGQYVLVAVTDTGTGMAEDTLSKAFEPFFSTKGEGKGTGLGLSQVYGFVKQTGGHIKIYSEIGQGTTIKLYLPRYRGERLPGSAKQESVFQSSTSNETILLVEDDERLLELTAASLRELGYKVISASCATNAIDVFLSGQHVDLLLTDIVMPDMNGRQLADRVHEIKPGLKILYMSGFTRNAIVHNGTLDAGVNLLAKPFTLEELSQKVKTALDTVVI